MVFMVSGDSPKKSERGGLKKSERDSPKKSERGGLVMFRKVILVIAIFVALGLGVYFSYFHRPPTADILAANLAKAGSDDYEDYDYGDDVDEGKQSQRMWDRWVKENKFVAIGKLFNKCNDTGRINVGRTIMLPDPVGGGVTSKTYLNVTLDKDVTGGQMYLTCQYNGNDLYSNHWDLCTVEDGTPNPVIHCPIRMGNRKFVKELKIPNYLPKGHYSTKAWLTNQDDETIGCAFADFSI